MFPEISDYLKSTLGGTISNFVQPDKITAATLFLLLNLIDIIVNLSSFNISVQKLYLSFFAINPAIQVGIAIALILMLAYLLVSFSTTLYKLFSGESWRETWPGEYFINRQKSKRQKLLDKSNTIDETSLLTRQELITSFAKEEAYVYPTPLGNVQNAAASYIWHHYGIDMAALWTHMDSVISDADKTLTSRVDSEKAALDLLVNMTFLLGVFAVELIVQSFLLLAPWGLLWALISIILAVVTYEAAVNKARTWGDVVQMAFDMHRDDLRKKLNIRPFSSADDERSVWQRVSSLLLWGIPADNVFVIGPIDSKSGDSPSSSASSTSKNGDQGDKTSNGDQKVSPMTEIATVTPLFNTKNVEAVLQSTVVHLDTPLPAEELTHSSVHGLQMVSEYIDYLLLVTITDTSASEAKPGLHGKTDSQIAGGNAQADTSDKLHVTDFFLSVSDPRLSIIYQAPTAKLIAVTRPLNSTVNGPKQDDPAIDAILLEEPGKTHSQGQVIWHIANIKANSSFAFRYQLPSRMFTAIVNNENWQPAINNDISASTETFWPETGTIDYRIVFNAPQNVIAAGSTLEVYDSRISMSKGPKYGCLWYGTKNAPVIIQAQNLSAPDGYLWKLSTLENDEPVVLTYTVIANEKIRAPIDDPGRTGEKAKSMGLIHDIPTIRDTSSSCQEITNLLGGGSGQQLDSALPFIAGIDEKKALSKLEIFPRTTIRDERQQEVALKEYINPCDLNKVTGGIASWKLEVAAHQLQCQLAQCDITKTKDGQFGDRDITEIEHRIAILNDLGCVCALLGRYTKAQYYFEQAKRKIQQTGSAFEVGDQALQNSETIDKTVEVLKKVENALQTEATEQVLKALQKAEQALKITEHVLTQSTPDEITTRIIHNQRAMEEVMNVLGQQQCWGKIGG